MSDLELYKAQATSCKIAIKKVIDKYIPSKNEKQKIMDLVDNLEELNSKYQKELQALEKYVENHKGQNTINPSITLLNRMKGVKC